jgi:hypothetical protein
MLSDAPKPEVSAWGLPAIVLTGDVLVIGIEPTHRGGPGHAYSAITVSIDGSNDELYLAEVRADWADTIYRYQPYEADICCRDGTWITTANYFAEVVDNDWQPNEVHYMEVVVWTISDRSPAPVNVRVRCAMADADGNWYNGYSTESGTIVIDQQGWEAS